jgi:hypothetical protein
MTIFTSASLASVKVGAMNLSWDTSRIIKEFTVDRTIAAEFQKLK